MKKNTCMWMLAIALSLSSPIAMAGDIWEKAESDAYGEKAGGMLLRGLLNAGSCFVDLVVQTVEKTQTGPPLVGTLTGIGSGAGCTILRAGSGILDIATFWVPDFNGIPVSRSYSNCLIEKASGSFGTSHSQPSAVPEQKMQESMDEAVTEAKEVKKEDRMKYIKK